MVTRILFDPRRDLPTGTTTSSPVILEATPTGIREDGSIVTYPTKLTFTINTGADVFQLPASNASTGWKVVVKQDGNIVQLRTIRVPDQASILWANVPDIDPASLVVTPGTAKQWDATFAQLVALINANTGGGGGGGGSTGTQYFQSTPASVWTITNPLGRRPTVDLYRLDGTQMFSDILASVTTVTVTFPSPIAGYAVLT